MAQSQPCAMLYSSSMHTKSSLFGFVSGSVLTLSLVVAAFAIDVSAATLSLLADRLQGYVLLQVESHGEAWYVKPITKQRYYLRDGQAAYDLMRFHSLGISNTDLSTIPIATDSATPPGQENTDPTPVPTPTPMPVTGQGTMLGGCQVFPTDNPWNQDVTGLPVHAKSATYIASIGTTRGLHPDFGSNPDYGIPFVIVEQNQPLVPITFTAYGDESDPGPYPVPNNAPVEGGSDHHVLVLQKGACKLYELYRAEKNPAGGWFADSGAVFNLFSNDLRPDYWTSADAAGLPILPGLIRYDEVVAGEITHAIRFTASSTQRGFIHPATHYAGSVNDNLPPMGLRVRMKASYDIAGLTGHSRVIAEAMKKYGMILADNGSSWYFQGGTDARWNDDDLNQLKSIPGSAFEAVYTGEIIK